MRSSTRKKLLYFMVDNPMRLKAGNMTRCVSMLNYLQQQADFLEVDFLSIHPWSEADIARFHTLYPDIELHLFHLNRSKKNRSYLDYFFNEKVPRLLRNLLKYEPTHLNNVDYYVEQQIKKEFADKEFDVLIVSYANWARLREFIPATYAINDSHDFLTRQYMPHGKQAFGAASRLFKSELEALQQFDEVWTYSMEEHYIFDQFLENKVALLPVSFPAQIQPVDREIQQDILYVASENEHNVRSMEWFIKYVLPELKGLKISVVGKICEAIPDHPSLDKLGVVEDLEALYQHSKITMCPMLTGTGIKIKVLESLAHGIPVVTNRRGVDGLVNKVNNGCLVSNNPREFALYIKELLTNREFFEEQSDLAATYFLENHSLEKEHEFLNNSLLD
ncbi:glycosyltransferase [Sphingobacterium humi]|uniref:Glycosyltransferase n=1 Tax=Sphingobacterium humi TaxID=1796905 RepID=A0A6N8KXQ9_9SPHI|nr:glycosyltransferase [Sphingobacterium humi]MVZ62263.1 glycosyltransferase [Sphingobacterium humi]